MRTYRTVSLWWMAIVLSLVMTLILVACGGSGGTEEEGETADTADEAALPDEPLLILEWSGYEATENPYFFVSFTEKYTPTLDAVVEYSFFADDSEALAKMHTGVGADMVHPCASWWNIYVEADLVQPIDTSRLSHWDSIHPDMAKMGEFNGQQYFAPWDWGYESILVRTDLVENVPTSWADVWNEEYAGHVSQWDSAESNFTMTAMSLGIYDFSNTTPEQDEQIKQKLLDLKPSLLTYWSDYTEAYDLPQTGDVWVLTNAWQDAYAYLLSEGYEVAYVQPEEKRIGWVCGFGIAKEAKNLDVVYEYLDSAIEPESMANLANYYWYGAANMEAAPMMDEFVYEFLEMDDIDNLFDRAVFSRPITEEARQKMVRIWDEVKASP